MALAPQGLPGGPRPVGVVDDDDSGDCGEPHAARSAVKAEAKPQLPTTASDDNGGGNTTITKRVLKPTGVQKPSKIHQTCPKTIP